MSGPRRRQPRRGVSRREFLRRSSQSAAVLGLAPLLPAVTQAAGGREVADDPAAGVFRHGVASGDPLADRVILWTRVTQGRREPVTVRVVLATNPELTQGRIFREASATAERDFTVKIDVDGLRPGTTYYYRFSALGQASPVGRTRTLPVGAVDHARIAVLSCSSYAHGFFNAYARVAERADLDLVLHLGDYLYEYGTGEYGTVRAYEPPHEMVTLDDYRTRHAQYKRDPDLQALHRQHPTVCVWDDHESTNDSWRDGAENHQPETEGRWRTRKAIAQRVYEEWMPIRTGNPARIFRRLRYGRLVDVIMLDTRLYGRSQPISAPAVPGLPVGVFTHSGEYLEPERSLLGPVQEDWLLTQLRGSTARWKLLGQQVMFGQLKVLGAANALGTSLYLNPDQWDGYPVARERIFAALRGDEANLPINNAVVLTGDIHTAWAMDLTPDPNNLLPLTGGYESLGGSGSLAVEFVTTSVTSPGLEQLAAVQDALRLNNPHIKFVDLASKGYLLLDITPERCQGEFWAVDGIAQRGGGERFVAAMQTLDGGNHLVAGTQSTPRANPPPLAP